jgi:hypothetical protein
MHPLRARHRRVPAIEISRHNSVCNPLYAKLQMGHRPDLQSKLFGWPPCRDLDYTAMHNLSWFAAFHRVLRQSADIRWSLLNGEFNISDAVSSTLAVNSEKQLLV